MKKTFLSMTIIVFLLLCSNGIQAQSTQTKLNQVELMKQWLGTWQRDIGKDTVELWEGKLYGKAVVINVYQVINGKRSDYYIINCGYDERDDKLKGYNLLPNSHFGTWIGMFTTDKIFKADMVDTFKPEMVWWKNEVEFKSPSEMIVGAFKPDGIKTGEWTYKKVK
jgi:hypothetical protein